MQTRHQVHNLIILDESGSMGSIQKFVMSGFNELAQSIKQAEAEFPEQQHFISIVSFNGSRVNTHLWNQPVAQLMEINASKYRPNGGTPLYDAMGYSFNKLKQELLVSSPSNVMVTIFTDGAENASREFNGDQIKKLVEDLEKEGWNFTYIGTDHDVYHAARRMSIKNVKRFEKTSEGVREALHEEMDYKAKYMANLAREEARRKASKEGDK